MHTADNDILFRNWALQLRKEHANICFQHRVKLRAPAFEVIGSGQQAGAWLPGTRTIQIGAKLIREHSWDVVLQVLRHEMAHQYVNEVLGETHGKAHGPAFQEACERLGVPARFRPATGPIPTLWPPGAGPDTKHPDPAGRKMLDRVDKMLCLAQSANEHEAAAAMRKANQLIRKYNLDRLDRAGEAVYDCRIINHKMQRLDAIRRQTATLLLDYFFVDVIYASLYDAGTGQTHKTIELLGTRENVAMAGYVYDFILARTEQLWRGYKKEHQLPQRLRRSYIIGIIKGFADKLKQADQPTAAARPARTTSALVLAGDAGLKRFINQRFPRLRTIRGRGATLHPDAYSAGQKAGKRLTIHRPVEHRAGNKGLLLTQ